MVGRAGASGQLAQEKLEVLWGSRGDPRQHALRRGELVDVQKIIADVRKSVDDLKKSLEKVKEDIDTLNTQVNAIEGRLNDAEEAINQLEDLLNTLEDRIDAAESALDAIEASVGVINGKLDDINSDIGSIGGDVSQLQSDLNTVKNNVTALTNRVTTLENGVASLSVTADLNTAVTNKEFQWGSTSVNTPVASSFGRGFTIASSANDLTQFGIVNATGLMFVRYRTAGTWGGWSDVVTIHPEPYALQSNPGSTPFPASVFTAIPFFTNGEATGITLTANKTFTVATAGLYQFELEVRINGGLLNMPVNGTPVAFSIDTVTVPTVPRAGYSISDVVRTLTITRLVCTERLAAGAQRVAYLQNGGMASYQIASAVIKITRLSA